MRQLRSMGISIDSRGEDDSTALIAAVNNGRTDAVKMLLSLGANPNAHSNNGWTPLFGAADDGYLEITDLLLKSGADPTIKRGDIDVATWADNHGHSDVAKLIRVSISSKVK